MAKSEIARLGAANAAITDNDRLALQPSHIKPGVAAGNSRSLAVHCSPSSPRVFRLTALLATGDVSL